jgi:xanthine dehydrogenase accessory factor
MSSGNVGGQRAVIEIAHSMRAAGRPFALLLVARTEGSTYRKPGALALVGADGTHVGVISGGCLEPGVELLAREAMRAAAPRLAVFDTRSDDDLLFGSGSGCRGRMHVLALPADANGSREHVDAIVRAGMGRRPIVLDLQALAPLLLDAGEVVVQPSPRVLIFGAGPETRPMLDIARTLGWYCCVVDHREALLAPGRIGLVDRCLPMRPVPALRELAAENFDAALVMSHVAETDLESLRALSGVEIAYVGLLGPVGRRDELLAQLSAAERETLDGRLHAPVGLPLGGEGPEAIALSIAAQLQQLLCGA